MNETGNQIGLAVAAGVAASLFVVAAMWIEPRVRRAMERRRIARRWKLRWQNYLMN